MGNVLTEAGDQWWSMVAENMHGERAAGCSPIFWCVFSTSLDSLFAIAVGEVERKLLVLHLPRYGIAAKMPGNARFVLGLAAGTFLSESISC